MNKTPIVVAGFAAVLIFFLICGSALVDENQAGFYQVKQAFPSGELSIVSEPGYFAQMYGTLTVYKNAGTYAFSDNLEQSGGDTGTSSIVGDSIPVRFSDGGTARIAGSARFDLPADSPNQLKIHNKFRSYDSLVNGLLKPAIRESVVLSAALMTAEESYSGGKAELSQLALDQLQNGVYLTESEEVETTDPITGQTKTVRRVQVRKGDNGEPLRKPNTLDQYGVEVTQLFFPDDFAYEKKILEQIGNVRDAQMKATAAFAEAEAAAQEEKTAQAKGRAAVAEAKASAEVEKQKAVTEAEKAKAVAVLAAESRRAVAEQDKLAAEAKRQEQILLGQGEAERKRLVMSADGALQQKLDAWVSAQQAWATAFQNRNVPNTVLGTSGAGSDGDVNAFMQLMTVKAAKDLGLDMTVKGQ